MTASTPSIECPICGTLGTRRMSTLDFRAHAQLPRSIGLHACDHCDTGFTMPRDAARYDAYYREMQNDVLVDHVVGPESTLRYAQQADALSTVLDVERSLNVLDFGCGQGGLLQHLSTRYPQHVYLGLEPCAGISTKSGAVTIVNEVTQLDGALDVVIFSHVFEHLVDFGSVDRVVALVSPDGALYVEVPDPAAYLDHPQREYLYYVDRLHVTHFSPASLAQLLRRWDMGIDRHGRFAFPYKGGTNFPAQYVLATRAGAYEPDRAAPRMLDRFDAYLRDEPGRFAPLTDALASGTDIVVYGFGDNFQRARSPRGPLAGASIRAVVDRRWQQLSQDFGNDYRFMSLDAALEACATLPFVVTVSWGGEDIAQEIRRRTNAEVFVL